MCFLNPGVEGIHGNKCEVICFFYSAKNIYLYVCGLDVYIETMWKAYKDDLLFYIRLQNMFDLYSRINSAPWPEMLLQQHRL